MSEETLNQASTLCETHKKFMNTESERFNQIISEIDVILDNCDRQMETTLHELAGDETALKKQGMHSFASSYNYSQDESTEQS